LTTSFAGAAQAAPRPGPEAAAAPPAAGVAHRASTARAAANVPPVFNNYLVCFNGWLFTDFTDPDGDDLQLRTFVFIFLRNGTGRWLQMTNSGGAGHGVFFSLELASAGIRSADVSEYWFNAQDPWGAWAGYTRADPSCRLL
jgi:hypothetical protein